MKVNEAKSYIEKAFVKIDEIQKRLNEIKTYESDYNYKKNCLVYKMKELGIKEYSRQKEILNSEYDFLNNMLIEENFLDVELKNILKILEKCIGCVFIDELSKQPISKINKPIHYKVFKESIKEAKTNAFEGLSNENIRFYVYTEKYEYYSVMELDAYFGRYKIDYSFNHCIDSETNIFDINKAKSELENHQIINIEDIEKLLKEGFKVIEEFNKRLSDLNNERDNAMKKFKDMTFVA